MARRQQRSTLLSSIPNNQILLGGHMKLKLAAACAALVLSTSANAGVYVGGGVSDSSYDYDDVQNSTGTQFYIGYVFKPGVFIEAAQVDLGDADVDDTSWTIEMKGTAFYVGYEQL